MYRIDMYHNESLIGTAGSMFDLDGKTDKAHADRVDLMMMSLATEGSDYRYSARKVDAS